MPQLRKVLQGAGATFSHWYVNTPVCCPSRSETLSGRYHHNLRNDGFRRDPDGGWCSGDEAVGEPHPCGCMDINNTALPDALAFHSQTYADYLQRASYVTVRMRPCPTALLPHRPLAPPSCRRMGLRRRRGDLTGVLRQVPQPAGHGRVLQRRPQPMPRQGLRRQGQGRRQVRPKRSTDPGLG